MFYTIYGNINAATDAKLDHNGDLWWLNFEEDKLGRLTPGTTEATLWPLPVQSSPTGLSFDDTGDVWISNVRVPRFHHFQVK